MAGFKQGALQLKKNDSELPADIGHIKVLVNTDSQLYTVDENGVSALIQGGGSGGPVYWNDVMGIPTATSATSGVLTSADWNKFSNHNSLFGLSGKGPEYWHLNTTEYAYVSGVSADIQTQLNGKMDGAFTKGDNGAIPVYTSANGFENSSGYIVGLNKEKMVMTDKTVIVTDDYHSPGIGVHTGMNPATSANGAKGFFWSTDTQNGVRLWIGTWGNPIKWDNRLTITSAGMLEGTSAHFNNISADTFVTNGGTSAQVVAGDGSLLYTSAISPKVEVSTGITGFNAPSATYGAGTISITSASVNLYDNDVFSGIIKNYHLTSAAFTLTDGAKQYIVADYNSGSPIYRLENNKDAINKSNVVLVRICWRAGNTVHSIDSDCQGTALANKIESALINTTPYKKTVDGGLIISESSIPSYRTILVTSAVVFAASTPHTLSAFNSSINKLTFASVSNGVWSYTSGTTQYNNSQYNPIAGLTSLGSNNYGVVWLYRSVGNDVEVFYVLGDSDYPTIAKAQTAKVRSDTSLLLRDHCILCGRIIIQKGASSGIVENVSDVSFSTEAITNHNDLSNIQGGSSVASEYYHLSATQYSELTSGGNTSLHYHSIDRDRNNHTGTQLSSTISDFTSAARSLISGTSGITYTSANGQISLTSIGTSGIYSNVVINSYGQVTSARNLSAQDIPSLSAAYLPLSGGNMTGDVSATNVVIKNGYSLTISAVSASTFKDGILRLDSNNKMVLDTNYSMPKTMTSAVTIPVDQSKINIVHNFNVKFVDIIVYNTTESLYVTADPNWTDSTTSILVIDFVTPTSYNANITVSN